MDRKLFTESAPGQLVSTNAAVDDWAFIPEPLPDSWDLPRSLFELWGEAKAQLGRLDGLGRNLTDPSLLLRPLTRRESLRSSSLEGTYATPEELMEYELDLEASITGTERTAAWREVSNYGQALSTGQELVDAGHDFSTWLIRQLHSQLLQSVRGDSDETGVTRSTQVHIGAGHRFNPPPPEHVSALMAQLEGDIAKHTTVDPLIRAFMIHYQFETIHPFTDGNGRVGRLLLSLMIYKWSGLNLPWLYLSAYFEQHKDDYISGLFNVSAKGDWESWIKFCLLATVDQASDTITRIGDLLALRQKYEAEIKSKGENLRLLTILPRLFETPLITYKQYGMIASVSYPTARTDIDSLIRLGILNATAPGGKQRYFVAEEIFAIAFIN